MEEEREGKGNGKHEQALLASSTIDSLYRSLKQQERTSIYNHCKSIQHDSEFVVDVLGVYRSWAFEKKCLPFTCFANKRNGVWYAPEEEWDGLCYFKSADGHEGRWTFSQGRLNLHVARAAAEAGGVVVVDSTRRGKDCPDSLTATVPIWCAVLNYFFFGPKSTNSLGKSSPNNQDNDDESGKNCLLQQQKSSENKEAVEDGEEISEECKQESNDGAATCCWSMEVLGPPWMSPSAKAQIQANVPKWAESLERLRPVLEAQLRAGGEGGANGGGGGGGGGGGEGGGEGKGGRSTKGLPRPLRPRWVVHARHPNGVPDPGEGWWPPGLTESEEWLSVVCVSASRGRDSHRVHHSWTYVQGAGDDEEFWAPPGLSAGLFWRHSEDLLALGDNNTAIAAFVEERLCTERSTAENEQKGGALGSDSEAEGNCAVINVGRGGRPIALGPTGLAVAPAAWALAALAAASVPGVVGGGGGGGGGGAWGAPLPPLPPPPTGSALVDLGPAPLLPAAATAGGSARGEPGREEEEVGAPLRYGVRYRHVRARPGKRAHPPGYWQKEFLPEVLSFYWEWRSQIYGEKSITESQKKEESSPQFILVCQNGDNFSVFAAVAILVAFFKYDPSSLSISEMTTKQPAGLCLQATFCISNNVAQDLEKELVLEGDDTAAAQDSNVIKSANDNGCGGSDRGCMLDMVNKQTIRNMMMYVQNFQPQTNVSRRLLKELNVYFIKGEQN